MTGWIVESVIDSWLLAFACDSDASDLNFLWSREYRSWFYLPFPRKECSAHWGFICILLKEPMHIPIPSCSDTMFATPTAPPLACRWDFVASHIILEPLLWFVTPINRMERADLADLTSAKSLKDLKGCQKDRLKHVVPPCATSSLNNRGGSLLVLVPACLSRWRAGWFQCHSFGCVCSHCLASMRHCSAGGWSCSAGGWSCSSVLRQACHLPQWPCCFVWYWQHSKRWSAECPSLLWKERLFHLIQLFLLTGSWQEQAQYIAILDPPVSRQQQQPSASAGLRSGCESFIVCWYEQASMKANRFTDQTNTQTRRKTTK